ncbi:MAG: hypothetical protein EZS28_005905 [Streblomastix strix]|uniref:Uncharacterized protein n=1 Tax=Streblomastix strix TaxID=222440 RepID=A0A5J4WU49_9EUKA|nr:MAG: hypothetical protein EZS28_005905 [Streblomastix strix]
MTYRWEIEQRSGRVIQIVDGRGLFNKERGIRGGFEGLESRDNSGFTRNKKQCQTQEILYISKEQRRGRTRIYENFLGGRVSIIMSSNFINQKSSKENNGGKSLRNNNSTMLAGVSLVDIVRGNNGEREGVGECEKVLEIEPKVKNRNLKVSPGRILALEVNGDKTEHDYFEMLSKHPDYQEIHLDLQCITGMEVEKSTPAPYWFFGTI